MANEASHKSAIIESRKAFCKRHYEAIAQAIQDAKPQRQPTLLEIGSKG